MNALSLFDGMSCGQIALNRIGVTPGKYYAAEIDKWAIQVTQANYPNTIQLGSVTEWRDWDLDWSTIDFVSGGFPCQAWSMAGKQLGDKDERGMLFWVMLDIMKNAKSHNPKIKFLIENVKMKKEFEDYITHHTEQALGEVNKVLINSALVSAQNRNRFYWTNWHIEQPEDKGIVLADIIETNGEGYLKSHGEYKPKTDKSNCIDANYHKGVDNHGQRTVIKHDTPQRVVRASVQKNAEHTYDGKVPTITASAGIGGGNVPLYSSKDIADKFKGKYIDAVDRTHYRKLTPTECERLQTVPDEYTNFVSNTQRYKMLGNGWTVDVIAHILSQMQMPVKAAIGQLDMFGGNYE
jgi:DNA-cytosine methyltransferase